MSEAAFKRANDSSVLVISDVTHVLSPDRAVEILRMASLSNHMSLLIARDEESR